MTESPDPAVLDDRPSPEDDENAPRPGPLRRHALWAVGVTLLGVGLGWLGSLHRIGPDDNGIPLAAPGPLWPYLLAWTAIGLTAAVALRTVAARVPPYCPEIPLVLITLLGTRFSLAWRPEPLALGVAAAVALAFAALWCAFALHRALRHTTA